MREPLPSCRARHNLIRTRLRMVHKVYLLISYFLLMIRAVCSKQLLLGILASIINIGRDKIDVHGAWNTIEGIKRNALLCFIIL